MIYFTEQATGAAQRETAEKLLLLGLKNEYGISKLPRIERMPQGKPYFPEYPEIRFNYSHSRHGILCGISDVEIGVDIERRIAADECLAGHICHENERKLLEKARDDEERERLMTRFWTAKESYLKCTGLGIRVKLTGLDFSGCIAGGVFQGTWELSFQDREDCGMAVCVKKKEPGRKVGFLLHTVSSDMLKF